MDAVWLDSATQHWTFGAGNWQFPTISCVSNILSFGLILFISPITRLTGGRSSDTSVVLGLSSVFFLIWELPFICQYPFLGVFILHFGIYMIFITGMRLMIYMQLRISMRFHMSMLFIRDMRLIMYMWFCIFIRLRIFILVYPVSVVMEGISDL